jgi:hypothetical protein
MEEFKGLNINNESVKAYEYTDFIKLINTPQNISTMVKLLDSFSIKFNPRYMYLSYVISHFKNELFYNSEPFLELFLFYKSQKITDLFEKIISENVKEMKNVKEMEKEIEDFVSVFKKWQIIDASYLTNTLEESFEELNLVKTLKTTDTSLLSSINTKQEFIAKRINTLKRVYPTSTGGVQEFKFQTIAEKAFWSLLKESLTRFESNTLTPQDIKWITDILQEILTLFNSLTPNNANILQENNDTLDIPLIKQRIEHNVLEPSYLNSLIYFIIKRIQLLQSASEDKDTNNWLSIVSDIVESPYCHYYDLLPMFFEKVYSKIYKIKSQLNDFHSTFGE